MTSIRPPLKKALKWIVIVIAASCATVLAGKGGGAAVDGIQSGYKEIGKQTKATSDSFPPPVEYSTLQHLTPEDGRARIIEKAAKTLPRPNQVAWQKMETTYFIHFGVNTFTGREWGTGTEDPNVFNPSAFDAEQWVEQIADVGGKMLIITVKHHDGFCLWPSRYTSHDVASSSWLGGQGNVLRAVADACHARGIKLGIYLSPADLHQLHDVDDESEKYYGNGSPSLPSTIPTDPAHFTTDPSQVRTPPKGFKSYTYEADDYNRYFLNQIYELCTEYGPIAEMWFDGANPKRGYKQVYNRADWYEMIYSLQPDALIAIDGPDVRWVGNERGVARETEWSVLPFSSDPRSRSKPNLQANDLGGRDKLTPGSYLWWYPAEADTKILSGWFWKASHSVRDTSALLDIYYKSVGRNANLLLNLSPDKRGVIPDRQLNSLRPFGQIIRNTFALDLAEGMQMDVPPDSSGDAESLQDDDLDTFWEAPESSNTASIVLNLPEERTFDVVSLQEPIALRGQRIEGFNLQTWNGSGWETKSTATTVGYKRLLRLSSPATTDRIRINITACRLNPSLAEISLYKQAVAIGAPSIGNRNADGEVAISNSNELDIRYTLDGSDPSASSTPYTDGIPLPLGGTIKAASFGEDGLPGIIASKTFPSIAPKGWSTTADSEVVSSANAVDDEPDTYWQSDSSATPHWIEIDMGETICVAGFIYAPPAGGGSGTVKRHRFETSADGADWAVRAEGEFGNIANNPVLQQVDSETVMARYVRFAALEEINGDNTVKVSKIGVVPGEPD